MKNVDTDNDGIPDVLGFPPFIRNANPNGRDIIPPAPAWKPFLWINPGNGTLFLDPTDPSLGYWADLTYAHGRPIIGGDSISATLEAPQASAQVFYQFDDLFHDNSIFSPHPTFSVGTGDIDTDGDVDLDDWAGFFNCLAGPGGGPVGAQCAPVDVDGDHDVDVRHFAGSN